VTAVLSIKNGQKIAEVNCVLGDYVLELISNRRKGNEEESGGFLSVNNNTVMK
jgi:hypothetical protein